MHTVQSDEPYDPVTGELPQKPVTGEIVQDDEAPREIQAADGKPAPYAAVNLGDFLNSLENGAFSAEVIAAMAALGQGMQEIATRTRQKQKGSITIKLDFVTEEDAFFVESKFTVKAPVERRPRTIVWQDDKGRFTRSMPRQQIMFGQPVVVGGTAPIRNV